MSASLLDKTECGGRCSRELEDNQAAAGRWFRQLTMGGTLRDFHAMPAVPLLDQAIAAYQKGALDEAEIFCRQAIAADPKDFRGPHMLAVLCHLRGRANEALAAADAALGLNPASADTLNLKGAIERQQPEKALASFTAALALKPGDGKIWLNHSSVLGDLGRFEEALQSADRAVKLLPGAEAWNNRAAALRALKRHDEALEACDQALKLSADYIPALRNQAAILCETFREGEGLVLYARQARLRAETAAGESMPHKARHDQEQRDYLARQNISAPFHLEDGARVPGRAVNPGNAGGIAQEWAANRPQIVVIDDFLEATALENLRRFCWGSTVWQKPYREGYLGALPESGFACPLLAQIAEELRATFPTIFERHPLRYLWGFKYDSALSGIDVHADFAAINVNFWITPDEANNNPEGGGLVVWDVAAPKDWNVVKYNRDTGAAREFLARTGARPRHIPYRANRAVVFDSDLFHQTDKLDFKPGYLNRRINITMLYGDR